MTRRHFSVVGVAVLLCLATSPFAAAAGYLKIQDVKGESRDDRHRDWIELNSFSFGPTRWREGQAQVSGAPTAPGSRSRGDISIGKTLDAASPKLFEACAKGTHMKEVTIVLRPREGQADRYLTYVLRDCVVTSYSLERGHGGTPGDRPMEQVTLNYTKIEWSWSSPPRATGRLSAPGTQGEKPEAY